MSSIQVHPDVAAALTGGRPVVALETAVLTHGLPRHAIPDAWPDAWPDAIAADREQPVHLEAVRAMASAVRAGGALPAIVGVLRGTLHIGLDDRELIELASATDPRKASASTLAAILARGESAGTTVAATLIACRRCPAGPIRVFATGGIGGVHRGWSDLPDISGDLPEIARTETCVVCAGAKSILDLPATLEALETLGVPVLGFQTDALPRFQALPDPDLELACRVDSAAEAAAICATRWTDLKQAGGVLLTNPIPPAHAVDATELEAATRTAEARAAAAGLTGSARTPAVLDALAELTEGRSLRANLALLVHNATLAAAVAAAFTQA